MTNHIHLRVEFGGGAELLFGNQKRHDVALHAGPGKYKSQSQRQLLTTVTATTDHVARFNGTLSDLIMWLKTNLLKGKEELFVQGNTVRPGILVLVNDTDWELLGGLECEVKPDDTSIATFAHCFHAQTVASHLNTAMETSQAPIKPQSNPGLFIQYAPVTPQVF